MRVERASAKAGEVLAATEDLRAFEPAEEGIGVGDDFFRIGEKTFASA